ncbi:MAG: helix-turn-helix transcriptional regulator [Oscillospiraceae bacterium]|nr:helix-turn-helix transcriptional regulator [Oscillospiraceae bacterium]
MFGKRLRSVRIEKKITQERLAEACSIALRTYQCYEQGVRKPSFDILVRLADELDVSLDYLLCRDEFIKKHK